MIIILRSYIPFLLRKYIITRRLSQQLACNILSYNIIIIKIKIQGVLASIIIKI